MTEIDVEATLREGLGNSFTRYIGYETDGSTRASPDGAGLREIVRERLAETEDDRIKALAEARARRDEALRLQAMQEAAKIRTRTLYAFPRVAPVIAALHGVTVGDLASPSRKWTCKEARFHLVWWLIRKGGMSTLEVGRRLKRDHSTIIHALGVVEKQMESKYAPLIARAAEFLENHEPEKIEARIAELSIGTEDLDDDCE